jgi:hypothetical protein
VPKRQFPLPHSLGGIQQRLVNILRGQARMLCDDFIGGHAVSDHRDHRGYGKAQSPDAGHAAHDIGVGGDPLVRHSSMLSVAGPHPPVQHAGSIKRATVKRLFEASRDQVAGRLPGVFVLQVCSAAGGCRECRRSGHGGAGSRDSGRNMPRGLRVSRAGSGFLTWRSIESSTTHEPVDQAGPERVRVVHPFHPWFGRDLEFVKRRRNWRADRVYVFGEAGELVSLPAEWTELAPADPFVVVAAGRAPFRTADLLKLADEVARLRSGADGVQRILS